MGAEAVATWQSRQPMAHGGPPAGEYAQAAWHRPKLLTRVISLRCTVAVARASDRGVFRCLGVRAGAGYRGADVAARGRRRARERRLHRFISFDLLSIRFSPKIQIGVLQTLNTKVVKQVTLFNNAKGSIGSYSLV
jgi:hypothetical protein